MSSILKALKKLETEKRSEALDPTVIDPGQQDTKPSSRKLLFALLSGLVAGGALVALVLGNSRTPDESFIAAAEEAAALAPAEPVVAGSVKPVEPPSLLDDPQAEVISEPVATPLPSAEGRDDYLPVLQHPIKVTEVPEPNVSETPVTPPPPAVAVVVESSLVEERLESVDIPRPGYERTQQVTQPDLPFVVSEIFYEEGSAANMAVVNDLPAMEGTLVDGVLLKTIEADRVLFEVDGQEVELLLQPSAE